MIFHSSSLSIKAETAEFNSWRAVINLCRLSCVERINSDRRFWNLKYYFIRSLGDGETRYQKCKWAKGRGLSVVDVGRMEKKHQIRDRSSSANKKGRPRIKSQYLSPFFHSRCVTKQPSISCVRQDNLYIFNHSRGVWRKKSSLVNFLPVSDFVEVRKPAL